MPSRDLIFRFIGLDAGAGREFDRMAAKSDVTGQSWAAAHSKLTAFGLGAAAAATAVAVESVKMAASFQSSTELIRTQAGASQAEVNKMRGAILGLAGPTATAPEELSVALYHIESTGARGAKALDELRISAEGAKVGHANLEDVTNALNATIVSGIGGVHSFSQAMGALNATVGAGDMHMQDLAEALGTGVLAVVKQYNVDLPQVGAALAVFGDNNIRGAQAATYLRMAVQALTVPAKQGKDALAQLGLTGKDAFTHFGNDLTKGGLTKALDDLNTRLLRAKANGQSTGQILTDAFGKRAGVGLSVLIGQFGRYQTKLDEVKQGAAGFGGAWTATTKNLDFQFQRFRADIDVLAIRIGDALIPAAMGAIHGIEGMGNAAAGTVHFFEQNKVATAALAGVLGAALVPAAARAATGLALVGGAKIVDGLEIVGLAITSVTTRLAAMSAAELVTAGVMTAGLTVGLAGAAYEFMHTRQAEEQAKQGIDDWVTSLHIAGNSITSLTQGLSQINSRLSQTSVHDSGFLGMGSGFDKSASAMFELYAQAQQTQRQIQTVRTNTADMAREFGLTTPEVLNIANALGPNELSGNLTNVESDFSKYTSQVQQSRNPTAAAAAAIENLGSKASTVADDIKALDTAWGNLVGNFIGMKQAELQAAGDLAALASALHKSHDSIKLTSQAGRDARGALLQYAGDIKTVVDATYQQTQSYPAAVAAAHRWLTGLKQTGVAGPIVKQLTNDIQGYLANLAHHAPGFGSATGQGFATSLAGRSRAAAAAAGQLIQATSTKLSSGDQEAIRVGAAIALGVASGIRQTMTPAEAAGANLSKAVIYSMRKAGEITSPSKSAARDVGKPISDGVTKGIIDNAEKTAKAAADTVKKAGTAAKAKAKDVYVEMHHVGRLLYEGLSAGWTGDAGRVKNLLGTQVENELNHVTSVTDKWLNTYQGRLKSARSTLHQLRQQFKSDVGNLAGSISGGSDLSNLFGTDANGNPTMGYASQFLSAQVGPLRQFSQDLARLRKMGLRSDLLSEIANLGPGQGDQVARQILSGQDGSVASLNSLQSQITSYAKASATTVEGAAYAGRFRRDEHDVRHQSRLLQEVRDEIRRLRHEAAHATARHVHVHIDSHGRLKVTGEDAREIAKAINREIKHGDVKIGHL